MVCTFWFSLDVINGALATHPVVGSQGQYHANRFYDSKGDRMSRVGDAEVMEKLRQLNLSN